MKSRALAICLFSLALGVSAAQAQPLPASVPYTPSWAVRHQLQLLADHANLALPLGHWPLPLAAVQEAVSRLPQDLPAADVDLVHARAAVQRELQQRRDAASLTLQLRQQAEGVPGYDENYTPGSSVQLTSEEKRLQLGHVSLAGRLGVRAEASSNGIDNHSTGWGTEGRYQARLQDSAAVLGWGGWQVQAFSQRFWWGPGWQNSLVASHNAPAWNGVGLQRSSVRESDSQWLNWMGPWNLDVFVAQAQDPRVAVVQPVGYLFSGARMTLQPQPWLQIGLSRGMQVGGEGRPTGARNFVKAFFGQEVNQNPGDPADTSSQIAGYDLRVRCPLAWGGCAAYAQWIGEDAAGNPPLPSKFMKMVGLESTYGQGRYRVFAEYADTNHPLETGGGTAPAYGNRYYPQGYTHGGRWIGSAFGGGSKVTTLGWMDAQSQRVLKLHSGTVLWSVGSGYPSVSAPHGQLRGLSASQAWQWQGLTWTPELSWTRLSQGQDQGANQRNTLRWGLAVSVPI